MIYVLLPAFNEEVGLQKVLPQLKTLADSAPEPFRIVVVDDGSRDRTSQIAQTFAGSLDLRLIQFEQNKGVGEVGKAGFRFVIGDSVRAEEDVCVVLDSDNTQDPGLIPEMLKRIRDGQDIVIASRFAGHGRMVGCPWPRQALSYGVSFLMRTLIRLPGVKDYSTFYRAYRVSVLKKGLELYGDDLLAGRGFSVMGGLLIKLSNVTSRMAEVPLVLRYDLKGGASGIKLWQTMRGYMELILHSLQTHRFRPASPTR